MQTEVTPLSASISHDPTQDDTAKPAEPARLASSPRQNASAWQGPPSRRSVDSAAQDQRPQVALPSGGSPGPIGRTGATVSVEASAFLASTSSDKVESASAIGTSANHALKATANTQEEVQAVFDRFRDEGKPVAVVSGGSLSGYAVALQLKQKGFNVLVAEARSTYTRQNIVALKEEAIYTLAKLSPDGKLLGDLLQAHQLSPRQTRIVEEGDQLVQRQTPEHRLLDWLMPGDPGKALPPHIPVRPDKPRQPSPGLDVELPNQPARGTEANEFGPHEREPLEHLDLAWPQHEVLDSVKPEAWHYGNLDQVSNTTLAIGQIRDLEVGLNRYCADTAGIQIVNARVSLSGEGDGDIKTTQLRLSGGEVVVPHAPPTLICLAEGKGPNTMDFSEQKTITTSEAWFQRNFRVEADIKSGSSLVVDPKRPDKLPVVPIRINREHDSVINLAHYANRDENESAEQVWARTATRTQDVLRAAGSHADADDESIREFQSNRIDVDWRRSSVMAKGNVVLVGDAAGTGSPIAGAGGSLAMSAYPEIIDRLVSHPEFHTAEGREKANAAYNEDAAKPVDVWQRKSAELMRALKLFPAEKIREINASSGTIASLKK